MIPISPTNGKSERDLRVKVSEMEKIYFGLFKRNFSSRCFDIVMLGNLFIKSAKRAVSVSLGYHTKRDIL